MEIEVQGDRSFPSATGRPSLLLIPDNWNDYGYKTLYDLWIRHGNGQLSEIGGVKIAFGEISKYQHPLNRGRYDHLPSEYFSLGQEDSYYENIRALGDDLREDILRSLRDIAFNIDGELSLALQFDVTETSLFRYVSKKTVIGQFSRIAHGGKRVQDYKFSYRFPPGDGFGLCPELRFEVDPTSNPPSNIHVIIGRNGSGKTRLLRRIAQASLGSGVKEAGEIFDLENPGSRPFVNLISVAFSAFDPFDSFEHASRNDEGVNYRYVGLRDHDGGSITVKDSADLAQEFSEILVSLGSTESREQWQRAVELLESDPNFARYGVSVLLGRMGNLANNLTASPRAKIDPAAAFELFGKLSSGHKIVLLTMTRLVELVAERSLVLIDEPESHLHPPLLAAFMRALSELLKNKNGVALVATHSPVVLQEVPSGCVYKMNRIGEDSVVVDRPRLETFGENVGILTHEIFGLEVEGSGFYREVSRVVSECKTYEEVLERFGQKLGGEARGLVRILLASKEGV
ncbi:AAA family ATPase [Rhodococcus sp. YH1]|uniref:AAA family ATPase n=1 Tax=Rhodococcus sp. YH1 TaxID=89066 RepID=UPI001386B234|nr:hypothetical protein [Rhodococcus sp. YH1]